MEGCKQLFTNSDNHHYDDNDIFANMEGESTDDHQWQYMLWTEQSIMR
jgi:hypothetical protein